MSKPTFRAIMGEVFAPMIKPSKALAIVPPCGKPECLDEPCQECCEHTDLDHGICLDCGKDRTDWLVGRAEAACEGER